MYNAISNCSRKLSSRRMKGDSDSLKQLHDHVSLMHALSTLQFHGTPENRSQFCREIEQSEKASPLALEVFAQGDLSGFQVYCRVVRSHVEP